MKTSYSQPIHQILAANSGYRTLALAMCRRQLKHTNSEFQVLANYSYPLVKLFHRRQILDSSKLKEFADDNFKLDESGKKFTKWLENTMGKGEIARYEQFLLFPQFFFQMTCTAGT